MANGGGGSPGGSLLSHIREGEAASSLGETIAAGDKVRVAKNGGLLFMTFPDGVAITPTTADILLLTGGGEDTSTACKVAVVFIVEK